MGFEVSEIDLDAKTDGVWVEFEGGMFLVAHSSKMDFQREIAKLQQPYIKKIRDGKLDPKVAVDIVCVALSKHILLDWKNVTNEGQELQFSPERAKKVLAINDDLREFISDVSSNLANFKKENLEEEGKPLENT